MGALAGREQPRIVRLVPEAKRDYDRVELVWPGKRTEVERVRLPFQTIERVNDVRRSHDAQAPSLLREPLPGGWPADWRNRLIWGDNKYVLSSLLDEFGGRVDLIYIDPPFATGADFSYEVRVSDTHITKQPSSIEELAYRDTWSGGFGTYAQMLYDRLVLLREILSPSGSLLIHIGVQVNHLVRNMVEEIFGSVNVVDEIIWSYGTPSGGRAAGNKLIKAHEYILHVTKDYGSHTYHKEYLPYSEKYIEERFIYFDDSGRQYRTRKRAGGIVERQYLDESPGVPLSTVWADIKQTYALHLVKRREEETGFPTQKPAALLERVINDFSSPGELVLDCFAGSGTTAVTAERLGRRWIAADIGRYAIHTTRKRLLDIPDCRPFDVQNLGRYERKHWQGARAGEAIGEYYSFILELFGARAFPGFAQLHGEKAGRMVHVGATDAPVTNAELRSAIEECVENGFPGLDVLGWEWEMGLNPAGKDELARHYGVSVRLYNIPREVMDKRAVDAGDVHFFELSVAEVNVDIDEREVTLELAEFLPALDDYMREKVAGKISKSSDWIDYWSVDFEFDGETFVNQWQAYRTRKNPKLNLRSDPHIYPEPGSYTVVVKVIDIFGNDTTREIAVEIP